ncbi:MAG: GatB/YqeY domain-containing protein [Thermoleophilaceae bacterium]|nr:GatB/YqeY domain-containing protein [Thermoleophilaceae bacterium]
MSILEDIQGHVNVALKAGEKQTVQTLRMVVADLQAAEKEGGKDEIAVLQSARKKRLDAAKAYRDADREDLALPEEEEAALIQRYLPEQISDDELAQIVAAAIAEVGATSPKDMGAVMKATMSKTQGRADGAVVSQLVKDQLSS